AIWPAIAATALGSGGLPTTVTCSRPRRRGGSPQPVVISASMSRSAARARTLRWIPVRSGSPSLASSTPRTSRPRITTCSMSATVSSWVARPENSRQVTPGRARPVRGARTGGGGRRDGGAPSSHRAQRYRHQGPRRAAGARLTGAGVSRVSRQEQVHVAELVPEVGTLYRGGVAPAEQVSPGECVQHQKVGG